MSVKYGASGLYHRRTSSLPASNSVTLCAWFYYISARSAYSYFMGLEDTSANYYALMGFDDANSLEVTTHDPSDRYFDFATAPAAGAWHFAAFAIGGATSTIRGLHMNPSNVWQTNSVAGVPSFTTGVLYLGNDSYDEWANVYLYNVKVWDTGLTDDEVKREAYSFYPVRRDKLHAHFPLSTPDDLRDLSGNNRVLTKGGTTHTTQRNPPGLGIKEERERLPLWWLGSVAAGGLTISGAGAIATGEAFGTLKNNFKLAMSALASSEAHGTQKLNFKLAPTAIGTGEAHGSQKLNLRVAPAALASDEAHGATRLGTFVRPSGIGTGEAHGSPKLNLRLLLAGLASSETIGATRLGMFVRPSGIGTGEAHGNAKLNLRVLLNGLASGETLGSARLRLYLLPGGIATGEAHGTAKLNLKLLLSALASSEAFGSHLVSTGALRIYPTGIASGEAFGSAHLKLWIVLTGIGSGEAFGTAIFGGARTATRHFTVAVPITAFTVAVPITSFTVEED